MNDTDDVYPHGRFIKAEWEDLVLVFVYQPFNGEGHLEKLERRRKWDEKIKAEMIRL
jgi:exonuclease III